MSISFHCKKEHSSLKLCCRTLLYPAITTKQTSPLHENWVWIPSSWKVFWNTETHLLRGHLLFSLNTAFQETESQSYSINIASVSKELRNTVRIMAMILPFTSIIYQNQHVFHMLTRYSIHLLSLWSLNSLHGKEQNGIMQKRAERSWPEFSLLIPSICSEHILVLCYSTSSDLSRTCSPDLWGGALSRTKASKPPKTTLPS